MEMMIIRVVYPIIIFAMLYVVAFISNRHCRDNDDVLFIAKMQWKAIFMMMLPTLLAVLFKR